MQAADELGMLIQVEPPHGYEMPEWRDILRVCRRHPSVVIYCCGNERSARRAQDRIPSPMRGRTEARGARGALQSAGSVARSGIRRNRAIWSGAWSKSRIRTIPTVWAKLKEFSDVFAPLPSVMGKLAKYERPCLAHELGIHGSYLNLNLETRYEGTRIGPDLFSLVRKQLGKAGLLDRAEVYYRNSAALAAPDDEELDRECQADLVGGLRLLGRQRFALAPLRIRMWRAQRIRRTQGGAGRPRT